MQTIPSPTKPPVFDSRPAQAVRVADYLRAHPNATGKEIDAACDTGSVTKVLSVMERLGYGFCRGWRWVPCVNGTHARKVRTYRLVHCPAHTPGLFD